MRYLEKFALILVAILTLILFIWGFLQPKESVPFTIAMGVLASLVAAIVYGGLVHSIVKEPISDRARLKGLLEELDQRERAGVETIKRKDAWDEPFWKSLLQESDKRFEMVAHAGQRWLQPQYREAFRSNLIRIARAGGTVRLLFMKPDGQSQGRVSRALGYGDTGYTERIRNTLVFLSGAVLDQLTPAYRGNLQVKYIETIDLPYMMIRTDRRVVITPYRAKTPSDENLVVVLSERSPYAAGFIDDFDKLFDSGEDVPWEHYRAQAS